jgi:hypothetical protein
MFAGRRKAEYGKWAAWYRGDCFVGFVYTYDRLRILNARLKNEPLPPVRKIRKGSFAGEIGGYGEIENYQEAFSKNFPLLYPEK